MSWDVELSLLCSSFALCEILCRADWCSKWVAPCPPMGAEDDEPCDIPFAVPKILEEDKTPVCVQSGELALPLGQGDLVVAHGYE